MKTLVVVGVFAVFAACGKPAALAPELNGVWSGSTVIEPDGLPSTTVVATGLWVDVTGDAADLQFVCPGLDGEVRATGDGMEAEWVGTLSCDPVETPACEQTAIVLTSLTVRYEPSSDRVRLVARGTVSGCGIPPTPATIRFDGGV